MSQLQGANNSVTSTAPLLTSRKTDMPAQKNAPELLAFGDEVKRLRLSAGLTQREVAALTNVARTYITQVELGNTRCRRDFAQRLDHALHSGTTVVEAWDDLLQAIKAARYPSVFGNYPHAEATASALRSFEQRIVYGLFQTEAYARVLLKKEEDVLARMRRQNVRSRTPAPSIYSVMDESVLYRQVGSVEIMREQLEFLYELSQAENICLQILPPIYIRNLWASFAIATQADQKQVVYTSKAYGGETSRDPEDLAIVCETFSRVQAQSLNVPDSRTKIREALEEKWT
ncbi:helix-turn-helix domain-containing protein [Actinomadura rupiterrae]|uniref:helix-turn-helix domain-containing protein n=1 Tax=Actinomadura rupiterrae TaxID=559627 RepID=UPI0020A4150D|nr:helix-turn-helix transcriptional regulator [Actinomadura rupiterrae]MCP2339768.1 transcriptional regulator with XRE-family HTH domain [Actinomadura rupiterrae]